MDERAVHIQKASLARLNSDGHLLAKRVATKYTIFGLVVAMLARNQKDAAIRGILLTTRKTLQEHLSNMMKQRGSPDSFILRVGAAIESWARQPSRAGKITAHYWMEDWWVAHVRQQKTARSPL
jgi:hypothetical protein